MSSFTIVLTLGNRSFFQNHARDSSQNAFETEVLLQNLWIIFGIYDIIF